MISQDTAYGTSKMKLESGVELVIPKPIRKLIPARIIAQYLTICDESGFKPASTRTLFRILEVCPASTRKSLQGLDNYTAEGSEAFENLEEIISKLYDGGMPDCKADRLRSMALSCKRYLKQEYSTHVVNDSTSDISSASPDHCRFFALSDPKEEQLIQSCLHSHLIECDRCQELRDLFLSLEEEIGKISERCPMASDDICDLRFLLDDMLQRHLDVGNHVRRLHRESQFDYIRRRYADVVNDVLSKPLFGANYPSESEQSGKRVSNITMGWALKKHKSTRFSTAVKAYLNDKFLIGEETGNKASPTQVAREMHRVRDDKGNRLFVGGECLSSQQIAAYFSRLAATKKKHGSLNAAASSDEVEEFLAEEQMQEHEEDISLRKKVVFGNLQLEHPITYKSYNLCKLAADGKLTKKFSIADLKDICDSLDIETEDFKRRKAPYKDVLTNVLSSCTCNKK
ncbi:unnamed protein product [Porites evermanni]|uniref:Uncharacterized protein n=1 Tax=Porites evermanni TaxID=104178 RepID=A0ABN8LUE2_9CNID|nr:unnamed protein product [Porites evermanni]